MTSRNEHFQPESVEEQLGQLSQAISRSVDSAMPEARLVEDLHNFHADHAQSGARVWARLAERLGEQNAASNNLRLITNERSHTERSTDMQVEQFTTQSMPATKPPRKPRRVFALVVALLAVALLVGSFGALVVVRHLGQITATTSATPLANHAQTPTVSPTPLYSGDCPNLIDLPYLTDLCQNQQFQVINQSILLNNVPDQPHLRIEAGYADASTIIIWSHIEWGANVTTPPLVTSLHLTSPQLRKDQIYQVAGEGAETSGVEDDFNTYALDNLPSGVQTLQLKLTVSLFPPTSADHIVAAPTFNVALPVHPNQIVPLNQTVTANGIPVTLNAVALDITGVRASLSSARLPYQKNRLTIRVSGTLQIGGLQPFTGAYNLPEQTLPLSHFSFTFKANLVGIHGTWTLTIQSAAEPQPWVFHFTV